MSTYTRSADLPAGPAGGITVIVSARDEAVRHVEDVTQRVHGEYVKKLAAVQRRLGGEGGADREHVSV